MRTRKSTRSRLNVFVPYYARKSLNILEIRHAVSDSAEGRKAFQRMLEFREQAKQEAHERMVASKYVFSGEIYPELFQGRMAPAKAVADVVEADEEDVFAGIGYRRKLK